MHLVDWDYLEFDTKVMGTFCNVAAHRKNGQVQMSYMLSVQCDSVPEIPCFTDIVFRAPATFHCIDDVLNVARSIEF